uniref:Uncharacterized protein n=1 Tax=virus sp. ctML55 TaxID=2827627 RepID=A0A8S5RIJ9_9VIRU|nr:MAG TPA: hypothetical protein [virus sp. ctML55]
MACYRTRKIVISIVAFLFYFPLILNSFKRCLAIQI